MPTIDYPTPSEQPGKPSPGGAPRTDLPATKEPYYEGYFGTEEEEGVIQEQDDAEVGREEEQGSTPTPPVAPRP